MSSFRSVYRWIRTGGFLCEESPGVGGLGVGGVRELRGESELVEGKVGLTKMECKS